MQSESGSYVPLASKEEEAMTAKKKRQRWVLRILYFVQTGAAAGLIKFLPVFFAKRLNLTATQIGATLVIGNVANFVGGLFWGRLADLSGRYKLTLLVTNASSVFFNFCLLANSITSVFWLFLVDVVLASFFGSCWGTLIDAVAVIGSEPGSSYGKLRLWAAIGWGSLSVITGVLVDLTNIGVIFVTFGVGMALSMILVMLFFDDPPKMKKQKLTTNNNDDNGNFKDGDNSDDDDDEEASYIVRAKHDIDRGDNQPWNPTTPSLDTTTTAATPCLDSSTATPLTLENNSISANNATNDNHDPMSGSSSSSSSSSLKAILCRTEVALLLANLFVQGVLIAFVESFLYVYLAKVYGVPGFFMGLCTFVAAVFECPVFYYSQQMIEKLGVKKVLTIAQFLYATRVWAYTYIPNNPSVMGYWLFLLTEPLHAFVFAAMWSAAVEYSRILAPPEHQGTMQALVRGLYYFIGNGVGSILGGLIIDSQGGGAAGYHLMYRFGGVAMAVWSLTWHLLMRIDASCSSKSSSKSSSSSAGHKKDNSCREEGSAVI